MEYGFLEIRKIVKRWFFKNENGKAEGGSTRLRLIWGKEKRFSNGENENLL
ncbi:hypothetical protein M472_10350 [Sphingobacterium paucimobilis HER1398]|uniref:Uncharacterized protein n=1 Tax=Sphingobacterium paucimobilis HER1398 TaxID=1346330 RepID=U2J940_9SPHI|nr:hypothetical protein M472_10350 [Sphingobacterium paucimobilis HER1398]